MSSSAPSSVSNPSSNNHNNNNNTSPLASSSSSSNKFYRILACVLGVCGTIILLAFNTDFFSGSVSIQQQFQQQSLVDSSSSSKNDHAATTTQSASSPSPSPLPTTTPRPRPVPPPGTKFDNYQASERELELIEKLKVEVAEKKRKELEDHKNDPEFLLERELEEKYGLNQNWLDDPSQTTETTVEERATKLPMALSLRQFSHVDDFTPLKKPGTEMQCTVGMMATRNCKIWTETLVDCVFRIGKQNFEKILIPRCLESQFWKEVLPRYLENYTPSSSTAKNVQKSNSNNYDKNSPDAWKQLNRGPIWDATIRDEKYRNTPNPYIEPKDRTIAVFPPPRHCSQCKQYPIGFGIPLSRFEERVARTKAFDWNPIRPKSVPSRGNGTTRINEEDFFHELYVQSFFGFNHLRGGYDSMRIWEQLASGTIPFYYDLERVPRNTIGHYPRELVYRAMHLPSVEHVRSNPKSYVKGPHAFGGVNFIRNGDIQRSGDVNNPIFDLKQYYELADLILEWARKYCTTRAVAGYVLKVLNAEDAKRVLIVGRNTYDYQEITLTHGFHDLGLHVTVVNQRPKIGWIEMRFAPDGKMTRQERDEWLLQFDSMAGGKGFGYSSRLHPASMRFPWLHKVSDIKEDIVAGKFDVVMFQLDGRHKEYVPLAKNAGSKIGFIQFRDKHGDPNGDTRWACSTGAGPVFIREMNDVGC